MNKIIFTVLILLMMVCTAAAADEKGVKLTPKDKCPVCGMFVAKYPDFLALIRFKDGSYAAFDGVKDMMKCYLNMKKYLPGRNIRDIRDVKVTEYYGLRLIDGFKAYYAVGSNVFGPMGKELIPLETKKDAQEFIKDHQGRNILRFEQIDEKILRELD
jgi:nitrous oxide reductase accessory protein NosL